MHSPSLLFVTFWQLPVGTQRLALRLAESEREQQNLLQSLQNLQQQNSGEAAQEHASTAEEELRTLHVMVNSLREELVTQNDAARAEKQRLEASNREHVQSLQKEREALQRARQELAERPSKEEFLSVRKQLKMVQKIAFNVQDDEQEVFPRYFTYLKRCVRLPLRYVPTTTNSFIYARPAAYFYQTFFSFLFFSHRRKWQTQRAPLSLRWEISPSWKHCWRGA